MPKSICELAITFDDEGFYGKEPYWCHEQVIAKKWKGEVCGSMQAKKDGWRLTLFKQRAGCRQPVIGFTKNRSDTGYRPDLEFLARFPRLLDHPTVVQFSEYASPMTSLDCEITVRGARTDVTTALRNPKIPMDITPFAMPYHAGTDISHLPLGEVQRILNVMDFHLVQHFPVKSNLPAEYHKYFDKTTPTRRIPPEAQEEIKAILLDMKLDGTEGWVLKQGGQAGKWFKVKEKDTIDGIITGVIPAAPGKFQGLIGSIVVSLIHSQPDNRVRYQEICAASGMDDPTRMILTDLHKQGDLIGKVVEISFQHITKAQRLVHPNFVRMRPDKPWSECTVDQLDRPEV